MKALLVLRHAKSSHDDPSLEDHDRPLAKRGKRAAKKIARVLDEERLWPERILTSTATRAAGTIRRVLKASDHADEYGDRVEFHRDLYTFDAGELIEVIRRLGGGEDSLMIVGHNPGLENLVRLLVGEHHRFPTAALAHIRLEIDSWSELGRDAGVLVGLWLPRELD